MASAPVIPPGFELESPAQASPATARGLFINPNTPQPTGMDRPGNTDLSGLSVIHNPDGSWSTVNSTSFTDEKPGSPTYGKDVLVRGILNNQRVVDLESSDKTKRTAAQNAIKAEYYKTGKHLGVFRPGTNAEYNSETDPATAYGVQLHKDWEAGKIPGVQMTASPAIPEGFQIESAAPTPQGPTISANPPTFLQRLAAPFVGEGSAYGVAEGKRTGAQFASGQNQFDKPLIDLSAAFPRSASEGAPAKLTPGSTAGAVIRGLSNLASGLTTPKNAELLTATFGAAGVPVIGRMLAGGFGLTALYGAYQQSPQLRQQIQKGDYPGAVQTATEMLGGAAIGAGALGHAAKRGPRAVVPEATANSVGLRPGEMPSPEVVEQQTTAHAQTLARIILQQEQPPAPVVASAPSAPSPPSVSSIPSAPSEPAAAPAPETTHFAPSIEGVKPEAPAIPAGFEIEKEEPHVQTQNAAVEPARQTEPAREPAAGGGQPEAPRAQVESAAPVTGTKRLYRVDSPKATRRGIPEWMQGNERYEAIKNATGRWFAEDPSELPFYLKDSDPGATISHVDVPIKEFESYRVSNQPPEISRFSARPEKEFFLPKDIADKRTLTHPDDLPEDIRAQYLPTGPHGKLIYPEGMQPRGAPAGIEESLGLKHGERFVDKPATGMPAKRAAVAPESAAPVTPPREAPRDNSTVEVTGWHGTNVSGGQAIGSEKSANQFSWLAENRRVAEYYANGGVPTPPGVVLPGGTLVQKTVSIENPLIVDMNAPEWAPRGADKEWSVKSFDKEQMVHEIGHVKEKAARMALKNGNDGIVFRNGYDARPYSGEIYAVLHGKDGAPLKAGSTADTAPQVSAPVTPPSGVESVPAAPPPAAAGKTEAPAPRTQVKTRLRSKTGPIVSLEPAAPAPITLSPAAQAAEAASRENIAERHARQEAEETASKAPSPLPKDAEDQFQKMLGEGLEDRRKGSYLTADPAAVRATYEKLLQGDAASAQVGKRIAVVHVKSETTGKGRSKKTQTEYRAMVTHPGRPPIQRTFNEQGQAAAYATDKMHSLGAPEADWNNYGSMGGVTERFIRTGRLLENSQSGLVAADAAAKAIGKPELAHDIYSQAFEGGWKGASEADTLQSIAERYAERLPRNDSVLQEGSGSSNRYGAGDAKTMLMRDQTPSKGYSDWESQVEGYTNAANGIKQSLEGIRKRIAIAEYLNGGTTPRIAESAKVFDDIERNVAKNLEFVKQAAGDETRKIGEDLEPGARDAALAYAKYGKAAFENQPFTAGATSGLGALDRYMRIKDIKGGYEGAIQHFGIEPQTKPNRIAIPETGKDKLSKAEKETLDKADLITGHIGYVSQGAIEKLRERGWVTDQLTDLGKDAVWSYRLDKAEGAAGLPMSKYVPAKKPTLPAMPEGRFDGPNAWNLVKGEVWYTNGHGAWKGEFPKNWPARDVNKPGPDIERVMPTQKGEPVEPIGFSKYEDRDGKPRSNVYFSNGSAMDAALYDYANSIDGPLKWTQTDPKSAFQGRSKNGLVAVNMPMRVDAMPEALAPLVDKAAEPAAKPKAPKGKAGESGSAQLDFLTLGATKFVEQDVAPVLKDVATGVRDTADDIGKLLWPSLRDRASRIAALILRGKIGELARKTDQAHYSVRQAEKFFNRQPAEDNFDFIDRMENGRKQKTPELDGVAAVLRKLYDDRRDAVQALGTGKLRNFYENYFAHVWEKPDRAKTVLAAFFGKRPLEGPKSFLKQRKYPTVADGRAAGLKPLSDNPVTLTLLKIREMDKYVMAHEALKDLKARYVDARDGQVPAGWRKIEDAIGTVYGQSIQQIGEYPNEGLYSGLTRVAEALGVKHERGFTNLRGAMGRAYQGSGLVRTLHGTKEGTLAHEIGHQIDWLAGSGRRFVLEYPDAATVGRLKRAYATLKDPQSTLEGRREARAELKSLKSAIADRKEFQKQLRDLADLREGEKSYIRKREEKMAQLAQMWAEGRELFERTAPKVFAEWKKFLNENPKLAALRDIEASANATTLSQPYDVGGLVIRGHWYLPDGAARMLDNYLSPGLNKYAPFRAAMGLNNLMNLFNLGLSGFHLTKTAFESVVSKGGIGVEALMRGRPIEAARSIASAPAAPFTAWVRGSKMLREWYTPGSGGGTTGKLMDLLTAGGARARLDNMYRTDIARSMVKAFRDGNLPGGVVRVPFAGMEGLTRLLMDEVVPRLKLGTMADMAAADLARLGPDASFGDVQRVMAETVNSVDNRMGEVARDNFFTHRYVKDISMFLMRADQYTLGTVREIGGAAVDLVRQPVNLLRGDPGNLKRLSYVGSMLMFHMAYSALYQYLHTGKWPEEGEDYFYPKNGQVDENGHPQRTSLMSYVKDVHSFARHPLRTVQNKAAPTLSLVEGLLRNRDFWNVEIRQKDDSAAAQAADTAKFVGKQFEPRSIENALRERKLGASPGDQAEQFFGLSPAPSDLNQSPAERLAHSLAAHDNAPRTQESAARRDLRQSLSRSLKQNKGVPADVIEARRTGKLTKRDIAEAFRAARETPMQRAFNGLSVGDAAAVYAKATAAEKRTLQPMLMRKTRTALENGAPADRAKTLATVRTALAGR